ncbi:hypothetical protein RRG08_016147 [Elysia crispata]|uniref:Apple domain-containing protein n=1 Tax=Elysia crispata TaxID=231223 RepID=A0AAE1D9I1_9GAST|nr:hypothetical protein RRG08_016147 [Elysia crispata]
MQGTTCQVGVLAALHTLAVFLLGLSSNVQAQPFCSEGSASAPVTLRSIVKSSFTAEIYSVDVKAGKATHGHEHYSSEAKISAVYLSSPDSSAYSRFQIYNRQSKTGVSNLGGGGCRADNSEPTFGLMSWRVAKTRSVSYVGTVEVAGETLHNWRACYQDKDFDYKEDLYITQTNDKWGNAVGDDYIPVKMVLWKRNKKTRERSQQNNYFLRFDARDDNDYDFRGDLTPPIGNTCDGYPSASVPQLPESIIYTSEPTDVPQKPVTYILDNDRQLIIMKSELENRPDQYRDVDSYKLGVNFQIPDTEGNRCLISPYAVFGDRELNRSLSYSDSYLTKPFESVQYFIGNTEGFTYNGEHTVRGIPCRVFSKFYEDYRGAGEITVVLYFNAPNLKFDSPVGGRGSTASVLIKKDVWKDGKVIYEHNIFNFGPLDYSRLEYDPLDISECEDMMGAVEFALLFDKDTGLAKDSKKFQELEQLKRSMKSELASTAGVDELRVHIIDVLWESDKLMAQVRLLGPLTERAYFSVVEGSILDRSDVPDDKFITETSWGKSYCERRAEREDEANFGSYCADTDVCTIYKDITLSDLSVNKGCEGFFLGKNKVKSEALDDAWSKVEEAVDSGKFQVKGYKASKVSKIDPSTLHNQTSPSIQKYEKIPGASLYDVVKTVKYSSLLDCTETCTTSFSYNCQGFTFCEEEQVCQHSVRPENKYGVKKDSDKKCDVYLRKHLTDFTAMETTSVAIDKEMVFEKVRDPNICARLCLDLNDFRCESFDFCTLDDGGGSGTCSLFRKHYFDVAESSQTVVLPHTKCTHYSRNYLGDYDRKDGVTSLAVKKRIRQLSPDNCAQSCSTLDTSGEARCTMFQFCVVDGICEFVDESSFTGDASRRMQKLEPKSGCATFSLKKDLYLTHSRSIALRASAAKAISSKLGGSGGMQGQYGPGAMAGLALVMLALGVGLLFLGLFLWTRYQNNGEIGCFPRGGEGKEMSMKFSKADFDC